MSNVQYTGTSAGIFGKAEAEFQKPKTSGNDKLGKDAFLTLLMTQMKYQDPLNPTSDKEFLAQLAQFSSLEQLTNINTGMEQLNSAQSRQDLLGAVSFIGKDVKAKGDTLSKSGDKVSQLFFTLNEPASKVSVNVFDANGNMVASKELGAKASGEQSFQWDGKNFHGVKQPDGVYRVGLGAESADGKPILVNLSVTGTVTGTSNQNGKYMLRTGDGRMVDFMNVQEVVTPKVNAS